MEISPLEFFDPEVFYFDIPLYQEIIATAKSDYFAFLMKFSDNIEGYSMQLKQPTTYSIMNEHRRQSGFLTTDQYLGLQRFTLTCVRKRHTIEVFTLAEQFTVEDEHGNEQEFFKIQKVG